MKNTILKKISFLLVFMLISIPILTGCKQEERSSNDKLSLTENDKISNNISDNNMDNKNDNTNEVNTDFNSDTDNSATDNNDINNTETKLEVCFGDGSEAFILHLYDNDTAAAIARHVGTENWRLPIYHYDDYDNWEVMQYYDIPSRYDIPSNPENITSEKAGEVYYSEPNRIVLFFGDAQVSGEYTKVGYFDNTEEFRAAVENNPVLEGWGNKVVLINSIDK